MPSLRTSPASRVAPFALSLLAALAVSQPLPADDAKPAQAPTPPRQRGADEAVRKFALRAANPVEVATILRDNLGCVATGSESTGMVIVSADQRMEEVERLVSELERTALERLKAKWATDQASADEARLRREDEAREQRERLAKDSIAIDFPGGTVGEYLDLVRKVSGFDNIVIGNENIKALGMPAVRVKRVTGTAAVILLQSLRFSLGGNPTGLSVEHLPGDPSGIGIEADPVIVIDLIEGVHAEPERQRIGTEVFDLSDYAKHEPKTLEQLLDAVRVAVEMQGKSSDFRLSLHEGTGLLFVRGNVSDIEMSSRTIRTFAGRPASPDGDRPESKE
jgi:hypothetical protein